MMKTILCAVDITRPDDEADVVRMAKRLADMDGGQLVVVTVVPDFGSTVIGVYFKDHDVKTAQDGAAAALSDMTEKAIGKEANDAVQHIVSIGSVYEEVLKLAKLSKADLIVIGAHKPDFKDFLLGPNASRVVRHSECSVHVVR